MIIHDIPRLSSEKGEALVSIIEQARGSALSDTQKGEFLKKCADILESAAMTDIGHRNRITEQRAHKEELDNLYNAARKLLMRIEKLHPGLWPSIMHRWPDKEGTGYKNKEDFEELLFNMTGAHILKEFGIVKQLEEAVLETRNGGKFSEPSKFNEDKKNLGMKHIVIQLLPLFENLTGKTLEAQGRENYKKTPRGHFVRLVREIVKDNFPPSPPVNFMIPKQGLS